MAQHSQKPVRDFPSKESPEINYWERSFPILYPYGTGGIESPRPVKLSLLEQTRWSLEQHDFRFRHHPTFTFVACNQQQRKDALNSCQLQIKHGVFKKLADKFSTLTSADLEKAAEEERSGKTISNPNARELLRVAFGTTRRVLGSDASRFAYRRELRAANVFWGPPTVWLTINPDDLHDPIAQIFAGEEIDLDKFVKHLGPDKTQRAHNLAKDGFAAAKFFHFLIQTIIKTLLGAQTSTKRFEATKGIFGVLQGYYGTVECQGRGTLHLHILLYLKGAPSWDEMKELLKSDAFRDKIKNFMRANFRAFYEELKDKDLINDLPTDAEIAYGRPPNPDTDDYWQQVHDLEVNVARTKQMHTCTVKTCIITDKKGTRCKRRAPWECSDEDVVREDGTWALKRTYGYQNALVPAIAVNARCNNDGKPLLNGPKTTGVTWYICSYATKKNPKFTNYSALFAKECSRIDKENKEFVTMQEKSQTLVYRCITAMMRQQELPAPLCVSYVMGWGDVYRSHHFVSLNWTLFHYTLLDAFPQLRPS